ncbi:MAG TPA: winged helix DNA-binding domain-containing protein, partial [Ardenticatenaceae bacterium]|nr:winged helix DNA-binding domain-containing protein [Ardenticatenaceae bacterium]
MLALTWDQVNASRLAQHSLLERAGRDQFLDVVARLGGLHAQLMSAAELQLWARVDDLGPSDVQDALWRDRVLVKTWAMRGTLHLLPASEFPLAVGALSTLSHFRRGRWLKYHGVTLDELEAILEGVRTILGDTGMTREQLADALVARTRNAPLRELLLSGWGALLKPAAFQGSLCFGPNQGQNVTFVRPDRWIGPWELVEPEVALAEIARRFLAVYGPATVDEFARWWGFEPSRARKIFRVLDGEIEMVSVEGWEAWALAASLEPMQTLQASHTVRLLPHFDPYVIAVARHSQFLRPEAHKGRIYRPQGWISPVVLVDGRIAGVWEHDRQRARAAVAVEMLVPP